MRRNRLPWQSKTVLLAVFPAVAASLVLEGRWWAGSWMPAVIGSAGLSALLGLVAWKLRSATVDGAWAGGAITACLMLETFNADQPPWRTALTPLLAVLVLTGLATRLGRGRKVELGLAESARGRNAAQVAANTGLATWMGQPLVQIFLIDSGRFTPAGLVAAPLWAPLLAVLAEAAADTCSSEVGQALGGPPRMITTLKPAEPGENGAITLLGTAAGILAAALVSVAGTLALAPGDWRLFSVALAGGVFGLLFDSLLGATLERRGWLNNDAVNFLSTGSAAAVALLLTALWAHLP